MCRTWVICLVLVCLTMRTQAQEPWADSRLPVRQGIQCWLDASSAAGIAVDKTTSRLSVWKDASGNKRDVAQQTTDAQPLYWSNGKVGLVRFDGINDHLRALKQNAKLENFSIFMVLVPRSNPASFTGIMAFNAPGQRDYQSGLNIDLGPTGSVDFRMLNVEGAGFGGATNLRTKTGPFQQLEVLELTSSAGQSQVALTLNGIAEGTRERKKQAISMDELTLGARFYNNGPGEQVAVGFCRCDIAEVIVYDRALPEVEVKQVRAYLNAKYAELKAALPPDLQGPDHLLVPVKNPPAVQLFLPGFTVRELPVSLTNLNNIKYRSDGTLVALGYNGNIWLLKDTNGDGLEDQATLFWENKKSLMSPIGMDLTPPNYPHGEGVLVAAEGKCVLIVDDDRDGRGDREVVVAGGWKDRSVNIDVVGVAVDARDGSVYFGRGTPNYANGYLLDKDGKSQFRLSDERGTIQRVAPDFKSREVIATGIRFPVGMRLNRQGDLFVSDQEGATWLPNGNPFDELLHIQKGRHYGFPPRHPRHLPGVIDEPSTFDYRPQHQSTCGMCFNEPVRENGPVFGPKYWAGDLFMTGYSRGKLYRTKLVKTPSGYVAHNQLIACLNMLTCDVCITPDGSLLVACHSGGPDWGSGPMGKGKVYKISYVGSDVAQPVLVIPSGPNEVRVEFDRPVEPDAIRSMAKQIAITQGQYVSAGDRFESLWPGYAVVQAEKTTPRYDLPVRSAALTPDRRSLILTTDRYSAATQYAMTLQDAGRDKLTGSLPQHPQIDLAFNLSGCEATWKVSDQILWKGWLPSADLQMARELTRGSAMHDLLWKHMQDTGELTLKFQLNLDNMLQPAVQPGSQLDYAPAQETIKIGYDTSAGAGDMRGWLIQPKPGEWQRIELALSFTGTATARELSWNFSTAEDLHKRPMQLHRFLVPWAERTAKPTAVAARKAIPELEGGSWARGKAVFFSEQASCFKCHAVHGNGASIGPELTNLIHRDYGSVYRDIEQPHFAINPDHLTYTVVLHDGRTLTGILKTEGNTLLIANAEGVISRVSVEEVESRKATPLSTMPEGVPQKLGKEKMKDLLTFLLTNPVSMPTDYPGQPPAPRTAAEVNAVLAGSTPLPGKLKPLRVVLVAGPKDHGPGEHDYPAFQKAWAELLGSSPQVEVVKAWEWPAKEEFTKADVMIFYQRGDWDSQRAADVDAYLERGGGLVYIHWAVDGRNEGPAFANRIGLAGRNTVSYRHGKLSLKMHNETGHPVLRNFNKIDLVDESYWKMVGSLKPDRVLATSIEEKEPRPQMWSLEQGRGRVFVSIPGHYSHTFDDPLFRVLLLRGIAWAGKEPVDRFNELVWPGARVVK